MARRRKYRSRNHNQPLLPPMEPETKKGIIIVIIFAIAFISVLSLFDLAGSLGGFFDQALKSLFGWADFLFPILLATFGYLLLNQEKFQINTRSLVGLFILFLSLSGFLQLILNFNSEVELILGKGGGYFGYAITLPLKQIMGWWATLIILAALFFISLILIFDTHIKNIFLFLPNLWQKLRALFAKEYFSTENEPSVEEEVADEEEEDDETLDNRKTKAGQAATSSDSGQPMQSKKRYSKIDIPLDLLDKSSSKPTSGDIKANIEKIKQTLEQFGIEVEMGEVNVGPTVTQFTLKPAEGVKLSKIVSLQNDLSLALAAHPIRIEAPIPGKSLVGIEIPNQSVAIVKLREILESSAFQKRRSNLYFAIGKDVGGQSWAANLETMPHLLIAGATGSGKSVCVNNIILSLLYQNSPDNLKFILVDPKRVEMTNYNDIPHLLTPVITEVDKTINALRWVVNEMDERYKFLSKHNKRNIASYNQSVLVKMPYIVVVIDELADLMAVAPREVEGAIIRLAQMARAVGIHLVMATQRPSVNVITGLIKANITSRIAFAVASQIDSRTILDTSGAEKLLGKGDMLFITPELSKPKRLQGAYVTDQEIEKVTGFLKDKAKPDYQEEVIEKQGRSFNGNGGYSDMSDEDELYDEAKDVVLKANKASASLLQRRLRVGYARAARLLDLLEEQGIIGPADGAKPREILINNRDINDNNISDEEENTEELTEAEDFETEEDNEEEYLG